MQRTTIFRILFYLLATWALTRCANPVTPSGGPKDTTPPEVIACTPPLYVTGFKDDGFTIDFDEFITTKNTSTELFVSPPLNTIPEVKVRGKSLRVQISDTLLPNATYSFGFGNAISDITENNTLKDFSYVFSTGSYIDSLTINGIVEDAFDLKPQKSVLIGLYTDSNDTLSLDSLPLHVKPGYVTRTDDNGLFTFRHLRNQPYKLFAIADLDGDMVFNQPSEKIAFSDSLVYPHYSRPAGIDTNNNDTTRFDTTLISNTPTTKTHRLILFSNHIPAQQILKSYVPAEMQTTVVFRNPSLPLQLTVIKPDSVPGNAVITEFSRQRDTLTAWFNLSQVDTIILRLADTAGFSDTLTLALHEVQKKKKGQASENADKLKLAYPGRGNAINQFQGDPVFTFSTPLVTWDFNGSVLISGKDTTPATIVFADSIHRKIRIKQKWLEETGYKLIIPENKLISFTGQTNDSIRLEFQTKAEKDFGTLILTVPMDNRPGQHIVQLLNEKEEIVMEKSIEGTTKLTFGSISPAVYRLRMITDKNRNGRWDTGEYSKKLQPETVIFFPEKIEIRANWEVEETWN